MTIEQMVEGVIVTLISEAILKMVRAAVPWITIEPRVGPSRWQKLKAWCAHPLNERAKLEYLFELRRAQNRKTRVAPAGGAL